MNKIRCQIFSPRHIYLSNKKPNFIYITGCDGVGKTTQARLLVEQFRSHGFKTRRVWLRFPFFFSLPLLAYARLRGYSWYEETGGFRHGYWDFQTSFSMQKIFPWILWLDAILAAWLRIYLPLHLGWTIVCERFVLDMIIDLQVASGSHSLHETFIGKRFLSLIPAGSKLFILDLEAELIRSRRPDLIYDRKLEQRIKAFNKLASDLSCVHISTKLPIDEVNGFIKSIIGLTDENSHYQLHQ